jgi:hypothetical protein
MKESPMAEQTWWESTKVQGDKLLETVKRIVREGNVRRIVIKQGDDTIAEFPLTAGVVGAVFAPVLAAIGALAALLNDCTIAVERVGRASEAAVEEETRPEPTAVND